MRKVWVCLIGILACVGVSHGQGAALTNTILGPQVQVRPNATVYICFHPSTTLTCPNNTAPLFSDIGLTTPTTNPTTTNAQGQFLVYAAAGTYDYVVTGPGITPQQTVFTMTVGGAGGGGGSTPAPPAGGLQLANSSVSAPATATCASTVLGVDSITSPTTLNDGCILNQLNDAVFKSGKPWYDVTAYGAKCDSTINSIGTDNTSAFAAAFGAALVHGGVAYIPRCGTTGNLFATNLSAFQNGNLGNTWLYVVDDNDLYITGGTITGNCIYVLGRASEEQAIRGVFQTQPHIDWIASASVSPLSMTAVEQFAFEGIGFSAAHGGNTVPAVSLVSDSSGNGIVFGTFKGDEFIADNCATAPAFKVSPNASQTAVTTGTGLFFSGDVFQCTTPNSPSVPALELINYGNVVFDGPTDSVFSAGGIDLTTDSTAVALSTFQFSHIFIEDLVGTDDMVTFHGPNATNFGAVKFDDVSSADNAGTIYLFGVYGTGDTIQGVNVTNTNFDAGYSLVMDPASTGIVYGLSCLNAIGCIGDTVSSTIKGSINLSSSYGRTQQQIYFGSQSTTDPALVVDSPSYGAGIQFNQGYDMFGIARPANPSSGYIRPYGTTSNQFSCTNSSGADCNALFGNLILSSFAGGGTQCAQFSNTGLFTGTGAPCGAGGSGPTLQTNGVNNTSQVLLNSTNYTFNGLTFTASNPSGGVQTWVVSGTLNNGGLTNSCVTLNGHVLCLGGTLGLTLASSDFGNEGTTVTVLHGNAGGAPAWGPVVLSTDVSGTLPNSNLTGAGCTTLNTVSVCLGASNTISANPTGAAGGDLSGTYPNPTVSKIDGTSVPASPTANQTLVTTAANVGAWETITDCNVAGEGSTAALNFTQSTHLFSCNVLSVLANPMTTIGDRIGGGASGVPTRIPGGLTGQVDTASNASVGGFSSGGLGGRTVAGTTDTVLCDSSTAIRDRGTTITYTSTSNVAITVPSAAATGCGSATQGDNNFYFAVLIAPASGTATYTFTPTTSTLTIVNGATVTTGATSLVLNPGGYATWSSPDNVNYLVRIVNQAVSATGTLTNNQAANGVGSKGLATGFADTAGTVTSGRVACFTASGTMGNCAALGGVIGVFNSSTTWLASGEVTITLDATVSVTFGDHICQSPTTPSEGHDNGNVACTQGLDLGFVKTTAASTSSATIFEALR